MIDLHAEARVTSYKIIQFERLKRCMKNQLHTHYIRYVANENRVMAKKSQIRNYGLMFCVRARFNG